MAKSGGIVKRRPFPWFAQRCRRYSEPGGGVAFPYRGGVTKLLPAFYVAPTLYSADCNFLGNFAFHQLCVLLDLDCSLDCSFLAPPEIFSIASLSPSPSQSRGVSSGRPVSWSPPPERRVISLFFIPLLSLFVPQLWPPAGCMCSSCVVTRGKRHFYICFDKTLESKHKNNKIIISPPAGLSV